MRQARHSIIDLIEIEPDVWADKKQEKRQEIIGLLSIENILYAILFVMFLYQLLNGYYF
jgi:hypothetical protein